MQATRIGRMFALVGALAFFLALVPSHAEGGTIPTPTGTGAVCVVNGKVQPTACAIGGGGGTTTLANGGTGADLSGCNANEIPEINSAGTAMSCRSYITNVQGAVATPGSTIPTVGLLRIGETGDVPVITAISGAVDYDVLRYNAAGAATTVGSASLYSYVQGYGVFLTSAAVPSTLSDGPSGVTAGLLTVAQSLAADFTTTLATATALNLTFTGNDTETWELEFWATASNPSGGIKWSIIAPVGSTVEGWLDSVTTTVTTLSRQRFTAVNTLNTTATNTGASVAAPTMIRARVVVSGSGAISIGVASVTAGQTSTVRAGSSLIARRVTAL